MTAGALVAGGFFGLLVTVAVYHLLLFAVLRAPAFLAYGAYVLALVAFEFARSPYAREFGLPVDHDVFFWWSFALLCGCGYAFFRSFLDLAARQPRLDRAFRMAIVVTAAGALVAPWTGRAYALGLQVLALAVLGIAAAAVFVAWRQRIRVATYFGIAYAGLFLGAVAHAAAVFAGARFGLAAPVLNLGIELGSGFQALTLALGLADRIAAANEERDFAQRRTIDEIRSLNVAYARFVPRAFLDLLGADDVRDVRLGDGVEREMTVLFSDVRSFTTISEGLAPRAIFGFINALLTRTGPVVREHGGIVDKYVGDAIMALFPGDVEDGLRAAIGLQKAVDALNHERAVRGDAAIAVGVGVHRGALMLGTIGEDERMDGTVIADAVNVASRIEGLTKYYGVRVLTTGAVRAMLADPDAIEMRALGTVAVKGTTAGVALYDVIAADLPERRAAKQRTRALFDAAVADFSAGRFVAAATGFDAVLALDPADGAARHLAGRAIDLAARAEPWTGVDVVLEK
jgi:adenylate cyclase